MIDKDSNVMMYEKKRFRVYIFIFHKEFVIKFQTLIRSYTGISQKLAVSYAIFNDRLSDIIIQIDSIS